MFDLDRWNELWNAMRSNVLRSILTAFGVFWGIFMLVVMAGSGKGLENGVSEGFSAFATNSAFIWTQKTGEPYKGFKRGRIWDFKNADMVYLKENIKEIQYLAPRLQGWSLRGGDNVVRGKRTGAFNINGDYPVYRKIDPFTVVQGRFLNKIDIRERRKVCIISERIRDVMFDKKEIPIGEYLRISGVYFKVVGIFSPDTEINIGGDKEETIYLPFTTLQHTFNYGDVVHYFSVTAMPGIPVSQIEDKIIKLMKERHSIAPNDKSAVGHVNIEKQFKQMNLLFTGIQVLIWIVGLGTLLAGIIGVSNIMLVIIRERTHEIGVKRAIGATPRKIMGEIIMESVFITAISGIIGLVLGVGILEAINQILIHMPTNPDKEIFFSHPEINLSMALAALVILIASGILAGALPAQRAIRIKTIDALRDEGI